MATVPSPPSLADVVNVFGGNGELYWYYRSGPYVPDIPANAGVPNAPGAMSLAALAGATNYVPLGASTNNVTSSGSQKGTFTVGSSTCNISGGNGNVTYRLDFITGDTNFPHTVSGNRATFTVTNVNVDTTHRSGIFRWTVSDGITSATADFTVSWN